MRKIVPLLTITAAVALFGAGCGGSADGDDPSAAPAADGSGPVAVEILAFQYKPDPVTVQAGDTIEWTNQDATVHTITAGTRENPAPQDFNGSIDDEESYSMTFDEPGTYDYFCTRHSGPGMTGKVIVE